MATIGYSTTSPFGSKVYLSVQGLAGAQATFARVKKVADDVTGGGVTPANLETSPLFSVATGQGSAFYTAVQAVISAIGALQAITDLDQG